MSRTEAWAFALQVLWFVVCLAAATMAVWVIYRGIRKVTDPTFSFSFFLSDLPSVNFRVFVGVCLAIVVVLTLLAGTVIHAGQLFNAEFDEGMVEKLLWFVWGLAGLDTFAFIGKRATHKPNTTKDAEDVPAPVIKKVVARPPAAKKAAAKATPKAKRGKP